MAEKKEIILNKKLHSSSTNISNFLPSNVVDEIEVLENKNVKPPNSTKNLDTMNIFKKTEKKVEENISILPEDVSIIKSEKNKTNLKNFISKDFLTLKNEINNPNINNSFVNRNLIQNDIPMLNYQYFPIQNYYNLNQYPIYQNNIFNTYNPFLYNNYQYFPNQMNNNPLLNFFPNKNNNFPVSTSNNIKEEKREENINLEENDEITQFHPLPDSQIEKIFSQVQKQSFNNQLNYLLEFVNPNLFIQILKTHKGSRQLQKMITNNIPSQKDIDKIVKIIIIDIKNIFCDYYGNYFLQKFFHFCSFQQRLLIYKYIKPNFLKISNNICGNHSLQCLILLKNSKEEEEIIKECINKNLYNLSFGSNSSHVIQKIISVIKEDNREYINNFMISNLIDLCLDANGICIVKEFINKTQNEFYIISIISIFEIDINKLTYNQFGNFGIQEAIKTFGEKYCNKIIKKLIEHIVAFSISKFSSNVVDFLIDYLSKNNFNKFCEILSKIYLNEENLDIMLKNKFANYVLENSLNIVNNIHQNFIENISLVNNNEFNNFINLKENIYLSLKNNPITKKKKKIMKMLKKIV